MKSKRRRRTLLQGRREEGIDWKGREGGVLSDRMWDGMGGGGQQLRTRVKKISWQMLIILNNPLVLVLVSVCVKPLCVCVCV